MPPKKPRGKGRPPTSAGTTKARQSSRRSKGNKSIIQSDGSSDSASQASDAEEIQEYVVEKIMDVRLSRNRLQYLVKWAGFDDSGNTWEPESTFQSGDMEVKKVLEDFREDADIKVKIEGLLEKQGTSGSTGRGRAARVKPGWTYVADEDELEDELAPREMGEDDEFYGTKGGQVTGEVKKLFDPSHKSSSTELFLAQMNVPDRMTRNRVKNILSHSNQSSRSSSVAREPERTDSPVPKPSTTVDTVNTVKAAPKQTAKTKRGRGRGKGRGAAPANTGTRAPSQGQKRAAEQTEEQNATDPSELEVVVVQPVAPAVAPTDEASEDFDMAEQASTSAHVATPPASENVNKAAEMKIGKFGDGYAPRHTVTRPERTDTPGHRSGRRRGRAPFPDSVKVHDGPIDFHQLMAGIRMTIDEHRVPSPVRPVSREEFVSLVRHCKIPELEAAISSLEESQLLHYILWVNEQRHNSVHMLCCMKCDGAHRPDVALNLLLKSAPKAVLMSVKGGQYEQTPLHMAVNSGQACHVITLLSNDCPVNYQDVKHKSALDYAYRNNDPRLMRILLQAGANYARLEFEEKMNPRNPRAFQALFAHSNAVSSLLKRSREKIYRDLDERKTVTPVFCAPCSEGPDFRFEFGHSANMLAGPQDTYLLVLYICRFDGSDPATWTARCWTGMKMYTAPKLNEEGLTHAQFLMCPMAFVAPLAVGQNSLKISLMPDGRESGSDILAAQIVWVRRREVGNENRGVWAGASGTGLEVAPLVGPI